MKALSQTPDRVTGVLEVLEMITGEFKDSAGDSMMGSGRVFHEKVLKLFQTCVMFSVQVLDGSCGFKGGSRASSGFSRRN